MEENLQTGLKADLRANSILFYALIGGVVIFLIFVIAVIKFITTVPGVDEQFAKILLPIVAAVAFICLVSAFVNYKRMLAGISPALSLAERSNSYRAALVRFAALCEGAALFSVISLFLTGNFWFVVITVIMLLSMFSKRPTKQRFINELQLNWQEQQQLEEQ
jgi:hypothetical protein